MDLKRLTNTFYFKAGAGHLNGWDFSDKESDFPPSAKSRDTKYVDEKE